MNKMMNADEVTRNIMKLLPHRHMDWSEYLKWWEGDNGIYNDMFEVAGYVLDEIIYETPLASDLAHLLERMYEESDDNGKEIIRTGLFEDLVDIMHSVWESTGRYMEKREILLRYAGQHASGFILTYDTVRQIQKKESGSSNQAL